MAKENQKYWWLIVGINMPSDKQIYIACKTERIATNYLNKFDN